VVEPPYERRDRARLAQPGLVAERPRGLAGRRGADHRVAGCGKPVRGRGEHRGLAGPGDADDEVQKRLLAGAEWQDHDLVFSSPLGLPLHRSEVSRQFGVLQEKAGVAHRRLYDCRHTAASLLLAQGVSPRVVMETLGHSSYALTMDTYTHVMPALMRDAADAMDRALRPPR